MEIERAFVVVAPTLSVNFSVKAKRPVAFAAGVPVIAPVFAFRLNPPGSGPGDKDHV